MNNISKTLPEVLAPAGGKESLIAAVRSGADAVYFGADGFNARRNAENFSQADFLDAVAYCRVRGVKVYITLNTLITDRERDSLKNTLRLICESGADAVIVQDLGVAAAVRRYCPSLPLHASTQTAVHNISGARELLELGFSRIVLARENSFEEIEKICRETGAETEIFVHGAHCMSVSGMCYMSSAFGARSGNRGLCAQPCRLNFNADGREYALSLKDMSLISHLDEIAEAGVSSLKIEGRMKRPEYVAAAVTAVKTKLAGQTPDTETLKSVFSRSGFTDGYFTGKRTLDMFGSRTKDDVTAASAVLPLLRGLYKDERNAVPVKAKLFVTNTDSKLDLTDGINTVEVCGSKPETAKTVPLNEERAERSVSKLGGTPYLFTGAAYSIADGMTLSASAMNAMRREAVEQLTAVRAKPVCHPFDNTAEPEINTGRPKNSPKIRMRFARFSQIPDGIKCERIILPVGEILKNSDMISSDNNIYCAEIPPLVYPFDEEIMSERLQKCRSAGIKYALCENIGAVRLARENGLTPVGGHMLNILNSDAAEEYRKIGVCDITLSSEMSFSLMREVTTEARFGFIGYGHMPLMRFRCCPMQKKNGCGGCSGVREITDRRGVKMTVLCSEKRFSTLYNPVPLYTGNMKIPPCDFVTLYFTNETQERCRLVADSFAAHKNAPFAKTSGLYDKELL